MSAWETARLGDVVDIFDHKRVPLSSAQRTMRKGPYPYYGAQGVIDHINNFSFDGRFILVPEDGENLRSRKLPIAYFAEGQFWVNNHAHIIKAKPGLAIDRFVQSAIEATSIAPWVTGAAQPKLSQANLREIPLLLPSYRDQQLIASFLDAFDDLIENNRRRVEVLEEMARTIYREWFVHFRYLGHESTVSVADGQIPEGWEVKRIAELSALLTRGIAPKYATDGTWVVLNQKCIRGERVSLAPSRRQERQVPEAKRVRRGDVVINSTGVGTLGRVALYRGISDHVTVDSHVTIARPVDAVLNPWYGLTLVSKQSEFERLATGSTGQTELSRADVGSVTTPLPPSGVLMRFAQAVWPLLDEADSLLASNDPLVQMRDLLLPKLVTGQIDVSSLDLTGLIEEAAV